MSLTPKQFLTQYPQHKHTTISILAMHNSSVLVYQPRPDLILWEVPMTRVDATVEMKVAEVAAQLLLKMAGMRMGAVLHELEDGEAGSITLVVDVDGRQVAEKQWQTTWVTEKQAWQAEWRMGGFASTDTWLLVLQGFRVKTERERERLAERFPGKAINGLDA